MSSMRLFYIALMFALVSTLQIEEIVQLPKNLQPDAETNFTVIGDSMFFINRMFLVTKMDLNTHQSQGSLNLTDDHFATGLTFFNESVGVMIVRNLYDIWTSYFCSFNPSDLSPGDCILQQGNFTQISLPFIIPNSPPSVVTGYLWNGEERGTIVGQVDVTTGVTQNSIGPCHLANGNTSSIDSFHIIENPADPSTVLLAIMCYPDPDTTYSELVLLDVESWTVERSIPLEADGTLVHAIINDILGYVEFINDSSSGELFQLVAYSVSKDAVVATQVITPYRISANNTAVVMEVVSAGNGTLYVIVVDFNGPDEDPEKAYRSTVTVVTYDSTQRTFTVQDSMSNDDMFFGGGYDDCFILNNTLYTFPFNFAGTYNENMVLIGE